MQNSSYNDVLRKTLRAKRLALSAETIHTSSQFIIQKLTQLSIFQQAKKIGIYWPAFGEVDLRPLLSQTSSELYLPVINDDRTLKFSLLTESTQFTQNRFGINEPANKAPTISAEELDIVCAPLVGFTKEGLRLGMGGGFYDKTFAFLLDKKNQQKNLCILIGIGYDFQQVERLEVQTWDVPMDLIVTDRNIYGPFKKPASI